jgi:hypothetical protein
MKNNELDEPMKPRNPKSDEAPCGIIRPRRTGASLFAGWGPRLL